MGAAYAEMKVLGYDTASQGWVNLLTAGSPRLAHLDGDGVEELGAFPAGGAYFAAFRPVFRKCLFFVQRRPVKYN